jgi:hypothetical protein
MLIDAAWTVFRGNDDYYRFVNHSERLATTGFSSEVGLLKNADIIRVDEGTLALMRARYLKMFPSEVH